MRVWWGWNSATSSSTRLELRPRPTARAANSRPANSTSRIGTSRANTTVGSPGAPASPSDAATAFQLRRYPHRNPLLGRESTADELAFLRESDFLNRV